MSTVNLSKKHSPLLPPSWTTFTPEETYHRNARSGAVVSASMLKEFRRCPAHYHAIVAGKAPPRDSVALRIGRAVHKLLLEGDTAYRAAFAVGGPPNPRTGRSFGPESSAFREWLRDNGLDPARVVTDTEAVCINRMREAVSRHAEAARLLSLGWPERSAEAVLGGLPCQSRMDWLTPDGVVVDVKTTRDIGRFEREARRFGYLHQFAFYLEVARAAGADGLGMAAVVVEKAPPFRVGVWRFEQHVLEPYAALNRDALRALERCRREGRWPTGYEAERNFPPAGLPPLWLN